jgi:serine/threonine protein kinase
MKKPSWMTGPTPDDGPNAGAELAELGFRFDDESWLETLRDAEAPRAVGRIGAYELLDEVSRGGQGVVFRARQPGTGREIAVKRMLTGTFSTAAMRLRFQREAEAAAALNHPGIVTVYGMEEVEGLPLYAMEWIDGVPADAWAADTGGHPRDPRDVLELFTRICDAVAHAHARGVLHRDLKPSNVLVDERGGPHVLDFGLARWMDGAALRQGQDEATLTADFVGTPAYAAPEQFHGGRVDQRTDIYSLGVMLHQMLTGTSPYGTWQTHAELIRRIEEAPVPRASKADPRISREVDTILQKALEKAPEERYATVAALGADVRRHLEGEAILAMPASSFVLARKLVQRNPVVSALASGLILTLAVFGGFASWQNGELRDQRDAARAAQEDAQRQLLVNQQLMALDPQCLLQAASLNPDYLERYIPRDGGAPVVLEQQPVREASAAWRRPAPLANAGPTE